jgi:putative hydrolase of the HAD superfamily
MSKLIFDLDGVIITYKKNFAETYSAEFGIAVEEIYRFFSNDYHDCAIGQSNLSDKIEKYISDWKWPGDAASLIKYWFDCQRTIDNDLIELIKVAKSGGDECYIASDQDVIRSKYIRGLFDFESVFNRCFFSYELGVTKADVIFFERILESLNCSPNEVYFWDDNPKNVATAKKVGIDARLYTSFEDFLPSFRALRPQLVGRSDNVGTQGCSTLSTEDHGEDGF